MDSRLSKILENIKRPKIAVVGDLILDQYIWGKVNRVSPEAPIQVLDVGGEEYRLGGAGNVANNLIALGARVACFGVVGKDSAGDIFLKTCRKAGIGTKGIVRTSAKQTPLKTRMIAHSQQVLRVDREERGNLGPILEGKLLSLLQDGKFDLVLISDYLKGLLSDSLLHGIISWAGKAGKDVIVDPKGSDYAKYKGASIVTPNRKEAEAATGIRLEDQETLKKAARKLNRSLNLKAAIITLGGDGMFFLKKGRRGLQIPAQARSVYDVTGAGDTTMAMLGLVLAGGYLLEDAVRLANVGAGVVVGKLGTATISREEIQEALLGPRQLENKKHEALQDMIRIRQEHREKGDRVVFTNGCFDILHEGHVKFLRFAKSHGDFLILGLNSDSSVKIIKGPGRPILSQKERIEILSALEMVDYIVLFDEPTPHSIVKNLVPDVLVKGEDWRKKGVVGRDVVEKAGGKVILAPLEPGKSTSGIIDRVLKSCGKKGTR